MCISKSGAQARTLNVYMHALALAHSNGRKIKIANVIGASWIASNRHWLLFTLLTPTVMIVRGNGKRCNNRYQRRSEAAAKVHLNGKSIRIYRLQVTANIWPCTLLFLSSLFLLLKKCLLKIVNNSLESEIISTRNERRREKKKATTTTLEKRTLTNNQSAWVRTIFQVKN